MQPLHPNDVPHPPLAEYTKQTCLFTLQVLHRNAEESEKMLDPNTDKSLIYFSLSQGPPLPNISWTFIHNLDRHTDKSTNNQ